MKTTYDSSGWPFELASAAFRRQLGGPRPIVGMDHAGRWRIHVVGRLRVVDALAVEVEVEELAVDLLDPARGYDDGDDEDEPAHANVPATDLVRVSASTIIPSTGTPTGYPR